MCPAAPGRAGLSSAPAGFGVGSEADGEAVPIRPLGFRELLDLPFAVLQSEIRLLAGLVAPAFVVAAAAVVAITAAGSAATDGSDAGTAGAAIGSTAVFAWLLRLFVRGVATPIGLAAVHRRAIGWRAALAGLRAELGPLLAFQAMYTLIGIAVLVPGIPLLITLLPALVWLGRLRAKRFAVLPVLFEESASYRVAVARAKVLAAGAEWQLAWLWVYLRALLLVLMVPLLAIPLFLSDFSGTHRWAVISLITAAVLLITAFTEVVDSITRVVSYVDRRCRREGWDIRIPAGGPTR
ncbi:hypothetical protein NDR87_23580 [Nocardia sp. CDC159]|uniref:Glycerophosphoryl diester phosphodiesterase membrane domain-containing protein n=1 Tax=Nocardia pulmonis TaxID=2951408 RepID=A0A9X2IYC6_9NOCA|nr:MULTISPECIES: hypothetical protein [Nocardia]MCM6776932.1 hypothetical protein [Nocardia pulmonis]MCM6789356.1 hypothetical protein [Nocardia sp. CDC159]